MNVTVEVCDEQLDKIVQDELQWHLDVFKRDIVKRQEGHGMAIFSHDQDEDVQKLQEHIDAFELILSYYRPATEVN